MDSNNSSTPTSTQGSTPPQDSASPSAAMPDQSSAPIYEPTPVQATQSLSTSETDVAPTQETTPGSASGAVENVATAAPADLVSTSTPNVASAPGSVPTMTAISEPVSPVYQPNNNRVGSTDPIMMPEPAQGPDPIEEELRAPMQAADPVPGSIGSAVSGAPSSNTPNVAFNDPTMQTDMTAPTQQPTTAPTKKKTSRATLILLIVIASIIVVALAVILVMQLTGNGDFNFLNNGSVFGKIIATNANGEIITNKATTACRSAIVIKPVTTATIAPSITGINIQIAPDSNDNIPAPIATTEPASIAL